ncbi:MAG TPA: hypothetical protein VJR29_01160 [bacterium]|nr:hypothetical protein [bacterium]
MVSRLLLALALLIPFAGPLRAEEVQLPEKEMLSLINKASGGIELYSTPDIPVENRNQFDLNDDGVAEWFIVPKTACGETNNCQFFVISYEKKKKKWRVILKADGKLTSLSPWGVIIVPHKTKGYTDLLTVFDMGPEKGGGRSLSRGVYVWDGKNYIRSTAAFPPPDASPDLLSFLKEVDKLRHERGVGKPVVD